MFILELCSGEQEIAKIKEITCFFFSFGWISFECSMCRFAVATIANETLLCCMIASRIIVDCQAQTIEAKWTKCRKKKKKNSKLQTTPQLFNVKKWLFQLKPVWMLALFFSCAFTMCPAVRAYAFCGLQYG